MNGDVLVVDDDTATLASIKEILQTDLGVTVTTAGSAKEALAHMDAHDPDVVIADFRMPGMDGLSLLKQLRHDHPRSKRIMMTAYPDLDVASAAVNDAKVQAFLRKPLDPDGFLGVVAGLLRGSKPAGA